MIGLSAASNYAYVGDPFTLTVHGSPGTKTELVQRGSGMPWWTAIPTLTAAGILVGLFANDTVIATATTDATGKADFTVTIYTVANVTYFARQNCMLIIAICDDSNDVTIGALAKPGVPTATTPPTTGGTTPATVQGPGSPLVLSADKAEAASGDTITFKVTGPPGTKLSVMHRIPTGDSEVASLVLDINGNGGVTWKPAAQGSYVFYAQSGSCMLWGTLDCKKSNEVTITVTKGACAPLDIWCILTGGGEGGESFTKWLGDTGKTVVIIAVIMILLYVFIVYFAPGVIKGVSKSAAAGAAGGATA